MMIINVQKEGEALWVKLWSVGKSSLHRPDSVKRSFLSSELSPINLSPLSLPPPSLPQTRITPNSTFYGPNLLLTLLWKTPVLCMYVLLLAGGWGRIGCVCLWGWEEGWGGGAESKWYKSVEIAQFLPTTQNKREHSITWTVDGEL
jgi:hypothetical protein